MDDFPHKPGRREMLRGMALLGAVPGPASSPQTGRSWESLRSDFLFESGHAYLNNASLGAPPGPVIARLADGYRRFAADPTRAKLETAGYIERTVLPGVAALAGARPDEVVLTRGASEGLHLIANGIDLQPGDEVVTTSQEHPGGLTPWLVRAERSGCVIRQMPLPSPLESAQQAVDVLSRALTGRTKVLFFCHVTRGGLLYPVRELCAAARSRGIISAVDGAQAVGMMNVDLHDLGCDLYAASLHKWFLAPAGNGFLFVRKETQSRFRSLFRTGADRPAPGYYEMLGTYSFPVRAAAGAALEFLAQAGGVKAIEERNRKLSDYLKTLIAANPRLRLVSSRSHDVSAAGITLFECRGSGAGRLLQPLLERYGLHVDEHVRDGHDAIRVSTHFYNSPAELDRLMSALRALGQ